ncbi:hypothetical protein PO883_08605 [Massilia sp. DJPM01]|uniref:hypothetical protein n=1 Tax=Massilia sp. DJPM01 TaxID=3024404 RepID=UPI00259E4A8F|nr:hypothetical protein [Massilia sp. DJPM01]MDM5177255.1 hypothetical protein [Massilia sp. DJPM01]
MRKVGRDIPIALTTHSLVPNTKMQTATPGGAEYICWQADDGVDASVIDPGWREAGKQADANATHRLEALLRTGFR